MNQQDKKQNIRQIIEEVYAHRQGIGNNGLVNGSMGLCINLYELGSLWSDRSLTGMADVLVDELFDIVSKDHKPDWNLGRGLAGIGWGIQHLINRKFITPESGDVLMEIDDHVFLQKVFGLNTDLDIFEGFLGMGYYFIKRLDNGNAESDHLSFLLTKQHLIGIVEKLDTARHKRETIVPALITAANFWQLPHIARFLTAVHDLDIFNSRVNKLISWYIEEVRSADPQNDLGRLCLDYTLRLIDPVASTMVPTLMVSLPENSDGVLVPELSGFTFPEVSGLNAFYPQSCHEEMQRWHTTLDIWPVREELFPAPERIARVPADTMNQASALGLLNGFNGFYKTALIF